MIHRATVASAILLAVVSAAACAHEPPRAPARGPAVATESSCHRATPSCAAALPTYAEDVRPILERRCFKCHAGNGVAADEHDFSRVETLRAQGRALIAEIGACAMPPSSEPPLSDAEADVLLRWAACTQSSSGTSSAIRSPSRTTANRTSVCSMQGPLTQ
jgi:hypothetical protein